MVQMIQTNPTETLKTGAKNDLFQNRVGDLTHPIKYWKLSRDYSNLKSLGKIAIISINMRDKVYKN